MENADLVLDLSKFEGGPSDSIDEITMALNLFDAWDFLRPMAQDLIDMFSIDLTNEFSTKAINKRQGKTGSRRRNRR